MKIAYVNQGYTGPFMANATSAVHPSACFQFVKKPSPETENADWSSSEPHEGNQCFAIGLLIQRTVALISGVAAALRPLMFQKTRQTRSAPSGCCPASWCRSILALTRRGESGQSLIETAVIMALMVTVSIYSVDFGYFFIVAANLTSSSRSAAQFSIQGFETPGQATLAAAGPPGTANTVAALALADLGSLAKAATVTAISVCSKSLGTSGNFVKCSSYGTGGGSNPTASIAALADPEAPTFYMNRVDVTYTIQPPIPISVIGAALVPNLNFHRFVVMRVED